MSTRRMSTADAAWLHMDRPTNLMVVNALMWFDEPLDHARALEVFRERLVERYPRFRQRVVEPALGVGVPAFADAADFDLGRHVHRLALPSPGDRAALQDVVADLMVTPLDPAKPLWDMYVLEGYGEGTAVLARMHHCIADGIALARVLLSLTDDEPDVNLAAEEQAAESHGILDTLTGPARLGLHVAEAALQQGLELAAHPREEGPNLLRTTVADAKALAKLVFTPPDRKSVFRGDPGVARRVAWTDPIALDEVKAIGKATGTTVNDVVLAAVTGALHEYLVDHDSVIDELRAMVPFNLRPLERPLPRELGNRFGLVYLALPVGLPNAAERLAEVHRRMAAIKSTPEGVVSYGILGVLGAAPLALEQLVLDVFSTKATAVMTNVPGPRRPVYFAGTRVAGVLGWVPAAGNIGLGVAIFSYDGTLTVGLQTAAAFAPDPETIVAAIGSELTSLAASGARPGPSRSQQRRPRRPPKRPPATSDRPRTPTRRG